jgi:hypothetical protein
VELSPLPSTFVIPSEASFADEGPAVFSILRTAGILPALLFLRVLPIFKFAFLNPMPLDTDYHSINDPIRSPLCLKLPLEPELLFLQEPPRHSREVSRHF